MVGSGGRLYFAPGIGWDEVDPNGPYLPGQFKQRIHGFYISPASCCIDADATFAFAGGTLVVSCIDALARLQFPALGVGARFKTFVDTQLPSFAPVAAPLYYDFRNGLVHEARIKNGGQFSLDLPAPIERRGNLLIINPRHLLLEVEDALDNYIALLEGDSAARQQLADVLIDLHIDDFRGSMSPYVG
jgi:hypothetical protein